MSRLLIAPWAVPLLGAVFVLSSCDGLLVPLQNADDDDSDDAGETDTDSDTDTDADTDTGTEEVVTCTTGEFYYFGVAVSGECRAPDAQCEGGLFPYYEQGDCPDGQVCCVGTGQCEAQPFFNDCLYTGCESYNGDYTCSFAGYENCATYGIPFFELGCPSGQVCCIDDSECDWGD